MTPTIPDGTYTAVVDRIEDTLATLELSSDADERANADDDRYGLVVGEEELPEDARHANAVLRVRLRDEELVDVTYEPAETTSRTEAAQDRFDRLSTRRSDDSGDAGGS